jgi:glucose/arabinose dehydrogenase
VEVVARGLVVPWSLALAPDGRLFVAERVGRIRVIAHDTLRREPWAEVPAADGSSRNVETGLMGLALHPDFASNPYVYVCYTERRADRTIVNRVLRLRERDGRGVEPTVLIAAIPAGPYHNGCRV